MAGTITRRRLKTLRPERKMVEGAGPKHYVRSRPKYSRFSVPGASQERKQYYTRKRSYD